MKNEEFTFILHFSHSLIIGRKDTTFEEESQENKGKK